VANPYAKPTHNAENMGRQSQQRVSNQHKRKFKLAQATRPSSQRRKGDQLTPDNQVAFQPERDCIICKAKTIRKLCYSEHKMPKRSHHPNCSLNKKTRGLGELSEQSVASLQDNKRSNALTAPIQPWEKHSGKNAAKANAVAFFASRPNTKAMTMTTINHSAEDFGLAPQKLRTAVSEMVTNGDFDEKHKSKGAPLAMIAFASEVSDKIMHTKEFFFDHFRGIEMEVPACRDDVPDNPHYHSIIGQKLLCIDWEVTHGIQVPCPDPACNGTLRSDRSNFSKNKTLFPTCGLDGPPM